MTFENILNEMAVQDKGADLFYNKVIEKINNKEAADDIITFMMHPNDKRISKNTNIKILSKKNIQKIEPNLNLDDEKVAEIWTLIKKELRPSGKRESNEEFVNKRLGGYFESIKQKIKTNTRPISIDFKGTKSNLKDIINKAKVGIKRDQKIEIGRTQIRFESKKASPSSLDSKGVLFAELKKLAIPFEEAKKTGKLDTHNTSYEKEVEEKWDKIERGLNSIVLPYLIVGNTKNIEDFVVVNPSDYKLEIETVEIGNKDKSESGLKRLKVKAVMKPGGKKESLNDFLKRMEKHIIKQNESFENTLVNFYKELLSV